MSTIHLPLGLRSSKFEKGQTVTLTLTNAQFGSYHTTKGESSDTSQLKDRKVKTLTGTEATLFSIKLSTLQSHTSAVVNPICSFIPVITDSKFTLTVTINPLTSKVGASLFQKEFSITPNPNTTQMKILNMWQDHIKIHASISSHNL